MTYRAPVRDMLFVMKELAGLDAVAQMPGYEDAGYDTAVAVLEESAKFNEGVVAPLNWEGDKYPSSFHDGKVTTTPGFKQAFKQFAEGGWQGLQHPAAFGGQGLPKLIHSACAEMVNSANMSFALCPLLTDGAIEAILTAGSPEQQATYLPKMIDGTWTGSMNLTEPQAGSDLSQVRTRAEPQPDGTYRLFGTKIFITYGEHDMAENIVHLVLARVSGAPEGVKGISLFICPKVLADGSPGKRNDALRAPRSNTSWASRPAPPPCCIYGDGTTKPGEVGKGAIGTLIGEENRGLEYMFIMMNAARFARRHAGHLDRPSAPIRSAVAYARDRVQSRPDDGSVRQRLGGHHPPPRRAADADDACAPTPRPARAMAYVAAAAYGCGAHYACRRRRPASRTMAFYEFMVPLVKGLVHRDERWTWRPRWACRCMAAWASSRRPARPSTTAMPASCRSMKAPLPSRPMT